FRSVRSMCIAGGRIFVGGLFQFIGGGAHHNLAAFTASTDTALAWGNPYFLNGNVGALASVGGELYVAGDFATLSPNVRHGFAAFDRATGQATPWAPQLDGETFALAIGDGIIIAGPRYTA